jgi:hypothetical protein
MWWLKKSTYAYKINFWKSNLPVLNKSGLAGSKAANFFMKMQFQKLRKKSQSETSAMALCLDE